MTFSSCCSDWGITSQQQLSPDFQAQRWVSSALRAVQPLPLEVRSLLPLQAAISPLQPSFQAGHTPLLSLPVLVPAIIGHLGSSWLPDRGVCYPWSCTSQYSEQDLAILKKIFRRSSEPYLELVLLLESTEGCRCLLVVSSQI